MALLLEEFGRVFFFHSTYRSRYYRQPILGSRLPKIESGADIIGSRGPDPIFSAHEERKLSSIHKAH